MGGICATNNETAIPDDEKSESTGLLGSFGAGGGNTCHRLSTIRNLNNEDDVSFYTPGLATNEIYHSIMSKLGGLSEIEFIKLLEKYNLTYYCFSTAAYVCKGDGILSDKERMFVEKLVKHNKPDISDTELNEILEGKDYTQKVLEEYPLLYDELLPKETTKEEKEHYLKNTKLTFILACVLAATQDGFVDQEYQRTKQVANNLGITQQEVKKLIKIVEAEIHLANLLKDILV